MNKYLEKIAEQTEYRGPSNWQTAGLVGAGVAGGLGALYSAATDVVPRNAWVNPETAARAVRDAMHNPGLGKKLAAKAGIGAGLIGSAAALPSVVAASRQVQDLYNGNPESHYLRSALLGGVAGGLAPTKHLTVGRGALAGLGASAANQIYQHYKGRDQYEQ